MPHHADINDLERRKVRLEEELEYLQQQLQRLRILRAQVVHQQKELVRQNGSKQQYDELQQHYQELLKLCMTTIEERTIIIDLLSQLERYTEGRFPSMQRYRNTLHTGSIKQQEQQLFLRLPDTSRPSLAIQPSKDTDHFTRIPAKHQSIFSRIRIRLSTLFLVLLLPLVPGLCFLLYAVHSLPHAPSTIAITAPRSVLTPTPKSIPSPAAKVSRLYPFIAQSYAGVINDIGAASEKTNMYLTQIIQDQNRISGSFQGLGLIGAFTGTVTSSGIVHFTVKIDAGTIIFDGNIKVGGDIRGTFKAVDQQGQSLGEYGDWNVGVMAGEK